MFQKQRLRDSLSTISGKNKNSKGSLKPEAGVKWVALAVFPGEMKGKDLSVGWAL